MPKGYWVAIYKSVKDPAKLAEYAKVAAPAMEAGGAKFLARGMPSKVYEAGLERRTVLIEFPSVDAAIKTHDSPIYQNAVKALGDGAEREIRIIEGLDNQPDHQGMPKVYWISAYKSIKDPNALAEYAKLAVPAMDGSGAMILARGMPTKVYEAGLNQRTVVVAFPSIEAAIKTYESAAYQRAVKALGAGAEREVRIVEAAE